MTLSSILAFLNHVPSFFFLLRGRPDGMGGEKKQGGKSRQRQRRGKRREKAHQRILPSVGYIPANPYNGHVCAGPGPKPASKCTSPQHMVGTLTSATTAASHSQPYWEDRNWQWELKTDTLDVRQRHLNCLPKCLLLLLSHFILPHFFLNHMITNSLSFYLLSNNLPNGNK